MDVAEETSNMSRMMTAPGHGSLHGTRTLDPAKPGRPSVTMSGGMRVAREVLAITLGAILYFFVRGLMETRVDLAVFHAESLIAFEERLGIFHEPWLQAQVLRYDWLATLANRVYIFGHWPVIAGTMTWLIWKHREQFAMYRSAMLLSGAIGLVCFVLLPMAPPRFLTDYGFIDTVTQHSNAYRLLQPPAFTNQYAAMPSLHVGWNLLMGLAVVRCSSNRWAKAFGVLMPLVMYLATIATANHYLLDGVVGSLVALAGLALAWKISRPRPPVPVGEVEQRREHDRGLSGSWGHRHAA